MHPMMYIYIYTPIFMYICIYNFPLPQRSLPDQVVTGKFNALEKNPDLAHIFEAAVFFSFLEGCNKKGPRRRRIIPFSNFC